MTQSAEIAFGGKNGVRRFAVAESGVSAVEFAVVAPFLVVTALLLFDAGMAINERMAIDHVLRSTAQTAMSDPGEEKVSQTMNDLALRSFGRDRSADFQAVRQCVCPGKQAVSVSCQIPCARFDPHLVFYEIGGVKDYSGILVPNFELESRLRVQVR